MRHIRRFGSELVRSGIRWLKGVRSPPTFEGMTLDADDIKIVENWMRHPEHWQDSGVVSTFEVAFAKWNGSRHAFAFAAGRKALSACIYAVGLSAGDEVVLPGYTCVVVQNAFDFAGIKTIHCDIELDTYGPDFASVASRVTPRTKAILVQHLYGLVCRDYERILAFARERGLKVIEDCAHATGATFRGARIGTKSDVAFYSSEWSKILTTVVGGIAVTNESAIANRFGQFVSRCSWPQPAEIDLQLKTAVKAYLRAKCENQWWSLPWAQFKYGHEVTVSTPQSEIDGREPDNYFTRMPAPAADLALNQLRKVDSYNTMRRQTASTWDKWCDQMGYRKPMVIPDSEPVFLRYPVLVEAAKKEDTDWARRELGIDLGVWFRTHLHPSPRLVEDCPNAGKAVAGCVNFPCLLPDQMKFGNRPDANEKRGL